MSWNFIDRWLKAGAPVTDVHNRAVTFLALDESGLARVCVAARQRDPSALTQLPLPQFARRHCQLYVQACPRVI